MSDAPLFYSDLTSFKALLPDRSNTETTPKFKLLLDSYLHHYGVDFTQLQIAQPLISRSPSTTPSREAPSKDRHISKDRHASIEHSSIKHSIWQRSIAGYTIVQQCWQTPESDKILIINHGYFDHTGLYGQLIAWGLEHGYRVIGYDMPGHGLSSGERAAIDSFDTYSQVLEAVIDEALTSHSHTHPHTHIHTSNPISVDLIGQSTGCAVIANYLLKHPHPHAPVGRVALLAPLVRSMGWQAMRWVYFISKRFLSSVKRKFINSSHNTRFNYFLQYEDPLQAREIPLSWLGAMESWYTYIRSLPTDFQNKQAITIIQGSGDLTVDWHHNLPELRRCFPNSTVHMIPKARHHLVKETSKFWDQVAAVLDTITPQHASEQMPLQQSPAPSSAQSPPASSPEQEDPINIEGQAWDKNQEHRQTHTRRP